MYILYMYILYMYMYILVPMVQVPNSLYMYMYYSSSPGTFAVVSLMVANAISMTLAGDEALVVCDGLDPDEDLIVVWNNVTMNCSDVKVSIAVTVAFLSGAMMVGLLDYFSPHSHNLMYIVTLDSVYIQCTCIHMYHSFI